MSTRIPIGNRSGLLVLAAVLAPIALKSARPLVKRIGRSLVKLGERLSDETAYVEEPRYETRAQRAERLARERAAGHETDDEARPAD